MGAFKACVLLQLFYAAFLLYAWIFDPWEVRDFEPPQGQVFFRGLVFPTFPHIFLGAFSFSTRNAMYCMVYLAYLTVEVATQLYLEWLPYTMGIIDGQRYFKVMMETGSSDRILPKWPFNPRHPVPTTEATYKMLFILLLTLCSTYAVVSSPKIQRRHGNMLIAFCSIFFLLPSIQGFLTNSIEMGSFISSSYTLIYGILVYFFIYFTASPQPAQTRDSAVSSTRPDKEKQD